MKPLHLALGIGTLGGILLFTFFPITPLSPQTASTAYAQSTPSVSFTQEEVQGKEGSTIYLRVKLDTPVTKTTKVTIKLTPDAGTTSRDIPGLTGTKTVTFYKNGTQTKTVAIRTSRTAAEGDKALTASITKVGSTTVQGDTARVLVKDQKSTGTILTGNNNTTATTTPPANCEPYTGVIPGDTRKLSVLTMRPPNKKYNYPMSAEGQAQHRSMFGYFGYIEHWFGGGTTQPAAFGNRPRMTIDSGRAFVVPFKTAAEYNYMPVVSTLTHETPETAEGVVAMSVSKCPGDFTSSFFAGTPDWQGNVTIPGTGQGKYCLSIAPSGRNQLDITVGNPGGFSCDLEPNTTYYFNITSGFSDTEGRKEGTMYPHIGKIGVGGTATTDGTFITPSSMVIDTISYDRSIRGRTSALERDNLELMKGKSEYYAEHRRIAGIVAAALQQRVIACRAAIATGGQQDRGVLGGGGECRGLPTPLPAYEWE